MSDEKEFFRPTTGGGNRPSSTGSVSGLARCPGDWDTTHTPGWDSNHLLHVTKALHVASKEEVRKFTVLDQHLVHHLDEGNLSQVDFRELSSRYYSSVTDALPYFIEMGNYFNRYTNLPASVSHFPFFKIPRTYVSNIGKIFPLPKQACAAVTKKDMAEAKNILTQWFELLVRIADMRILAAWHLSRIIERRLIDARNKLKGAEIRYQSAYRAINGWYKNMKEASDINKFVDELKAIEDLNNDINFVIGAFKAPLKTMKSTALGQLESKLAGGKGKWDVIKAGITMMGEYLATVELVAYHGKTSKEVLTNFTLATEDIYKYMGHIAELDQELHQVSLIGEMNPAIYGLERWGML